MFCLSKKKIQKMIIPMSVSDMEKKFVGSKFEMILFKGCKTIYFIYLNVWFTLKILLEII